MRRFLFQGETPKPAGAFDVLIVGSGLAGLYAALHLDADLRCGILTKEGVGISNSWLAQGGIAAAVAKEDKPRFHFEDTLAAGAGLCDPEAVAVLVDEGPRDIATLVSLRVPFDLNEDGDLKTGREGGHRLRRVVHAHGDATGRETVKTLAALVAARPNVTWIEHSFLVDVITDGDGVLGGVVLDENGPGYLSAPHIIIATGGIGQAYPHSTNPSVATGDGLAAARRCGAVLQHMEFVQFHPTGLYDGGAFGRTFLISEALRGEGAVLLNAEGERFMLHRHPMAELAPRDIVARGIVREMARNGRPYVELDIRGHSREELRDRFPTIYGECAGRGFLLERDPIPVCPVQHYSMGGIATDLNGMSNLPGLYACGEAACTGVHGANRLASNSMLECLVFGRRAAAHIGAFRRPEKTDVSLPAAAKKGRAAPDPAAARREIQTWMGEACGVIRNGEALARGLERVAALRAEWEACRLETKEEMETVNLAAVAEAILRAALARPESVGAHYREEDREDAAL